MSTRAHIGIKSGKMYRYIYHHSDSYLENLGVCLLQSYNTAEMANKLVNLGNMRYAMEKLEDCNTYTKQGESYKNNAPRITFDFDRFSSEEYNYYYDLKENCWFVTMDEWATTKGEKVTYKLTELMHDEELLTELFEGHYTDEYFPTFISECMCA